MSQGDELRARRLARNIASIGMLDERIKAILDFGDARYQEGYEAAAADLKKLQEEEPPRSPPPLNF